MRKIIRIATRESKLALWQADYVKQILEAKFTDLMVELIGITTTGDRELAGPLNKISGKGLFVKELEMAMQAGRADIAVHSVKDLPMDLPEGFSLPAVLELANPYDAFVSNQYSCIKLLPEEAVVGTSSLRRSCQLKALRPDLQIKLLRGNVDTRLKKLDAGEYDAIILAAAGLQRLKLANRIRMILPAEQFLPAAGQGAIGIECLTNNKPIMNTLKSFNHYCTHQCINAERALNRYLNGNCHVPIGAYAISNNNELYLRGLVGEPDGKLILRADIKGPIEKAEELGAKLAEDLIQKGADKILKELN